jgi:hypothetical protein
MKLNGWQRLWVLLAVLWLLPVAFFTYELWPQPAFISKGNVYMQLKHDDGGRLTDYYDVLATMFGGTNAADSPLIVRLRQDKDFLAASTKEQKAYLADADPEFKRASTTNQNAYLDHITGRTGPSVEIDGTTVQFVADLPQEDMNQTARAYHEVTRGILIHEREVVLAKAFAYWLIPALTVYAMGLAIVWVRRGFYRPESTSGHS